MNNTLLSRKKIAIIGGGPGGLTLARLLQMKGADITVYERDEHRGSRPQGATLDLHHESGLAALTEAGLMDGFRAAYRPGAGYLRILDKTATIRFDSGGSGNHDFNRPEIDRGPLNDLLLDSLDPGTVIWNSRFTRLARERGKLNLEFGNGSRAIADIVIAADGANSKVRPFITSIKPVYSGQMIVEGAAENSAVACPAMHGVLNGGKIFAFADSKMMVVSSKGDGSLIFYLGFNAAECWARESGIDFSDKVQVISWFQHEFNGWSDAWLQLFEKASGPFIPRPQYCMPLGEPWDTLEDLTMLGDAAHVMPPSAGEGVNMAMLDAVELSQCLLSEQFRDVRAALSAYEKRMHDRMRIIGAETLENAAWMSGPDALEIMVGFFEKIKSNTNN